jgi:hypothetical protein
MGLVSSFLMGHFDRLIASLEELSFVLHNNQPDGVEVQFMYYTF